MRTLSVATWHLHHRLAIRRTSSAHTACDTATSFGTGFVSPCYRDRPFYVREYMHIQTQSDYQSMTAPAQIAAERSQETGEHNADNLDMYRVQVSPTARGTVSVSLISVP